ncbi:MAG: hypothetical protein ABW082_00180 [Sedimenticola sp.]
MKKKQTLGSTAFAVGVGLLIGGYATQAVAFNFGDMMSPGKWMGNKKDRYYDDVPPPGYYGGPGGAPYGYGGNPGPGYGAQPYGYGAPPAGGQAPYGYGANPYGYGGQPAMNPAYQQTAPQPPAASQPDSADKERIRELEERIRMLESQQQLRQQYRQ